MNLRRKDLQEDPFSSAALVYDNDGKDKRGKAVASVVFSSGGNVVYLHRPELDTPENLAEIMVAAEKYIGETFRARRYKVFHCTLEGKVNLENREMRKP